VTQGVPVIRGQNLGPDRWVAGEFVFVSEEKANRLAANLAEPGDLVFTQRGNAVLHGGQVAVVPSGSYDRMVVSQSQMKLTVDPARVDASFIYYIFKSPAHRDYLRSNAIVTGVPHTNLSLLRDFPLLLPPLPEQRAIARILGTLDDKIELIRKMNHTLEALAAAIFRSWFVDFVPVMAKGALHEPPGTCAGVAALFPSAFVDSEMGPIPAGWTVEPLGSIIELVRRVIEPGEYPDEMFDHFSIPAYDDEQQPTVQSGSEIKSAKFLIPAGSVLISKLNPETRRVWLPSVSGTHRAIGSTEFLVAVPRMGVSQAYVYSQLSDPGFHEGFAALATGTTGSRQRAHADDLLRMPVVVPDRPLAQRFAEMAGPIFQRIIANRNESRTQAGMRDLLLPKLLSGEVRIGAAKKAIEAVV
jgi:type I restriction enzyme S subunit